MVASIDCREVTAPELTDAISFSIPRGSLCSLLAPGRAASAALLRLILGFERPLAGRLEVLGEVPGESVDLQTLRRRMAVVQPTGGLVSNLKVLENILLPLSFFAERPAEANEERALAILKRLGYQGNVMEMPGHLSLFQRRLVGLARAILMDSDLVIYHELLADLSDGQRRILVEAALSFHRQRPGRTSLFLTANAGSLGSTPFEHSISLLEKSVHV